MRAAAMGILAAVWALGCTDVRSGGPDPGPGTGAVKASPRKAGPRLRPFGTQAALDAFLRERAAAYKQQARRAEVYDSAGYLAMATPAPPEAKTAESYANLAAIAEFDVLRFL